MSDLWINIAFGEWHLTLAKNWNIDFSRNESWRHYGIKPPKWFRIYQIGNWHGDA